MAKWRHLVTRLADVADGGVDRLRALLAERRGTDRPLVVVPYLTYGTPGRLWIRGRVLRDPGIRAATDDDRIWHNVLRAYRRFVSSEVAGTTVAASLGDLVATGSTDEEGYFDLDLLPPVPVPPGQWQEVVVVASAGSTATEAFAEVLIPPADPEVLIISDIDDTVLHTQATSLLRMVRNTLVHNARTRTPFSGVSELYDALRCGPTGEADNPVFYVSNGPWNLFDFIVDFMQINGLPPGPILLRDYGFDANKFLTDPTHKRRTIESIFATYPTIPAILIGDSGEHDPEIYRDIALDQPDRIAAIYIRDASMADRDTSVRRIASQLAQVGVDLNFVADSSQAADHAARHGLITQRAARTVSAAVAAQDG